MSKPTTPPMLRERIFAARSDVAMHCCALRLSCDIGTHTPAQTSSTNFLLYHHVLQLGSTNCLGRGHGYECHRAAPPHRSEELVSCKIDNLGHVCTSRKTTVGFNSVFRVIQVAVSAPASRRGAGRRPRRASRLPPPSRPAPPPPRPYRYIYIYIYTYIHIYTYREREREIEI